MPCSAYHTIGCKVAEWLAKVPECQINTSTRKIADALKNIRLDEEEEEEIVSFDVSSLYTNFPVVEAIDACAEFLYNGPHNPSCRQGDVYIIS